MEWLIFIWVACAVACWIIANSRARFAGIWFLLGLMFGPFALLVVILMPSLEPDKGAPSPKTHIKCPDCRELILRDAKVCKHCRCKLIPQ